MEQQIINGILLGSTYSLIAIGYSLVFGLLKLINLAQGEIFMVGGFLGLMFIKVFHVPFFLAVLLAMAGAGLMGLLLELICFRPVKRHYFLAPALSTLGFGIIIRESIVNFLGSEPQVFPAGVNLPDLHFGHLMISSVQMVVLGLSVLLLVALIFLIQKTELGYSIRALSENTVAARLLGIRVNKTTMITFFISAALAGAAGMLIGLRIEKISPFIDATLGMKGLAIMIIGGLGNIKGAMLGGLLVGLIEVLTSAYLGAVYTDAVPWGLLFLVLVFWPEGIFGSKNSADRV